MFTQKRKGKRGRPPGQTSQGVAARRLLYETAIRLIGERGFGETTLRDVAQAANVSVGLLYRYFPSKQAVVLALYDELSVSRAARGSGRLRLGRDTRGPERPQCLLEGRLLVREPVSRLRRFRSFMRHSIGAIP